MVETIIYKMEIDTDEHHDERKAADSVKDAVYACGVQYEIVQYLVGTEPYTLFVDLPSDDEKVRGEVYSNIEQSVDGLKDIKYIEPDTEIPHEKLENIENSSL